MIRQGVYVNKDDGKDAIYYFEHFDSLDEMTEAIKSRKLKPFYSNYDYNDLSYKFHGVETAKEAYELAKYGYDKPVKSLKEILDVRTKLTSKIAFEASVVGFAPIVPNAILGLPMAMISSRRAPIKSKIINIVYDGSVSCGVKTVQIEKAGAEMMSIIQKLESEGYRINLSVSTNTLAKGGWIQKKDRYKSENQTGYASFSVKVKDANQPLDVKRTAFAICHPAFVRFFYFEWVRKTEDCFIENEGKGTPLPLVDYHYNNFKALQNQERNIVVTFKEAIAGEARLRQVLIGNTK